MPGSRTNSIHSGRFSTETRVILVQYQCQASEIGCGSRSHASSVSTSRATSPIKFQVMGLRLDEERFKPQLLTIEEPFTSQSTQL